MEILRDGSFDGTFVLTLEPSSTYDVVLSDMWSEEVYESELVSDANGDLVVTLPERSLDYDGDYNLIVSNNGARVFLDVIEVVRPYCDIDHMVVELGNKFTKAQVTEFEMVARQWIDTWTGQFKFKREILEFPGTGTDYLITNKDVVKIYNIWENGELIDDVVPASGIVVSTDDNKIEYRIAWRNRYSAPKFAIGSTYKVDADYGYQFIPSDIQLASRMLVADIACGNNRYSNKYISQAPGIKYFEGVIHGTGNLIVNNILMKYIEFRARAL